MARKTEFEQRIDRIDTLLAQLESGTDPALRTTAKQLVQSLMDLHGAGLERMLTLVHASGETGVSLIAQFAGDELVRSLMLLYGLHPDSIESRVLHALDRTRSVLASQGATAELVSVGDDGVVRLRLRGTRNTLASASATTRLAVEGAIRELAPEIEGVVLVEESENGNRHVSLPIVPGEAVRGAHPEPVASGA